MNLFKMIWRTCLLGLLVLSFAGCGGGGAPPPGVAPAQQAEAPPAALSGFEFTCDKEFPTDPSLKPPLPRDGLPTPGMGNFEELPLNVHRVIGFKFIESDESLIAQPVSAVCQFIDPTMGMPLGAIWVTDQTNQVSDSAIITMQPDTATKESAQGRLIHDNGEVEEIAFMVAVLARTPDTPEPPMIDVTIPADTLCFRYQEQRLCAQNVKQLSAKALFAKTYAEQVEIPIQRAVEQLIEKGLLPPDAQVDFAQAVSEIEAPARIQECFPGKSGTSCEVDLIAAALLTNQEAKSGEQVQIGIIHVAQTIDLPAEGEELPVIPAGNYVVSATMGDGALLQLPVWVSGITTDGEVIPLTQLPAIYAPYTVAGDWGIVEIAGMKFFCFCLGKRECS